MADHSNITPSGEFLSEILHSLDYALDPCGICYLEEKLFYNRITGKLVCIYLPLKARIQGGSVLTSSIKEHGMDEHLHVPMKNNWISVRAMEKLYSFFRSEDEAGAVKYIQSGLWEDSRSLPHDLNMVCSEYSFHDMHDDRFHAFIPSPEE